MIVNTYQNCNNGLVLPIRRMTPGTVPVRLINTLERLKLLDGLRGIWEIPEGVALELGEGAALEWALRKWSDSAEEFAAAVGRAGFVIVPTMTVHILKHRGCE